MLLPRGESRHGSREVRPTKRLRRQNSLQPHRHFSSEVIRCSGASGGFLLAAGWLQSCGSSKFISGSPPENTIQRTPRRRMDSSCGSRSRIPNVFVSLVFQMSHITQRQLQELCACTTRTGSAERPCVSSTTSAIGFKCSALTCNAHLFTAEINWSVQMRFRVQKQSLQRSTNPTQNALYRKRLQPSARAVRQAFL